MVILAEKNIVDMIAGILLIVGGINWGLVGAANFDLVAALFGASGIIAVPILQKIVYILIGLSALYIAYTMYFKK